MSGPNGGDEAAGGARESGGAGHGNGRKVGGPTRHGAGGDGAGGAGAGTDRRLLVTGAAGFIGSHLSERLLAEGHEVWGLDAFDDTYDPALKRANVRELVGRTGMHLIEGDVRDEILLDGLMSDVAFDAVVHLAARPGVRSSIHDPCLCYDVNVRGTLKLLEAMRRHRVPALLFGSSGSVYGEATGIPFREDAPADRPVSPFAASKRAGEMLCHVYHHLYGLSVTCLRFFTVYGPRQRPDLAIHRFARLLREGKPVPLYGDGSTRRDYTHVDDIVEGIVRAILRAGRRNGDRAEYRIVNLGSNRAVELRELVALLAEALGVTPTVESHPARLGDVSQTRASGERGRELLGYEPRVGLEEGLAGFVAWLGERGEESRTAGDRAAGGGG